MRIGVLVVLEELGPELGPAAPPEVDIFTDCALHLHCNPPQLRRIACPASLICVCEHPSFLSSTGSAPALHCTELCVMMKPCTALCHHQGVAAGRLCSPTHCLLPRRLQCHPRHICTAHNQNSGAAEAVDCSSTTPHPPRTAPTAGAPSPSTTADSESTPSSVSSPQSAQSTAASWPPPAPWPGPTFLSTLFFAWGGLWAIWALGAYGLEKASLEGLQPDTFALVTFGQDALQLLWVVFMIQQLARPHQPLPPGLLKYELTPAAVMQGLMWGPVALGVVAAATFVLTGGAQGTAEAETTVVSELAQ